MKEDILARILALKTASLPELQKEYEVLFNGKKAPSNNKTHLWQRIAYRIQELEYGVFRKMRGIRPKNWHKNTILSIIRDTR